MPFLLPHHFKTGFKRFLKTKGLSAERVEIYLKDKQKFVIGELVFRDSKFAYVRFIDTAQGLNDEKILAKSFQSKIFLSLRIEDMLLNLIKKDTIFKIFKWEK